MKKLMLVFAALVCGIFSVTAQDLIVKIDATEIKSKVLEIAPDVVKYKKFSNLEGPTYILPVSEIDHILFANGEKEQFRKTTPEKPILAICPSKPSEPVKPAEEKVAPTPAPKEEIPEGYVRKRFEVGEFYDRGGVRGVICSVTEDGQHGLVVSLQETTLAWCNKNIPATLKKIGLDDKHDGEKNLEKLKTYIAAQKIDIHNFAPFAWCGKLGDGWYLPSINELLTIAVNFNGGNRAVFNREARSKFNDTLRAHGGAKLDRLMYYFTSTESEEAREVLTSHMAPEPPYIVPVNKTQKWLVRAVHKF